MLKTVLITFSFTLFFQSGLYAKESNKHYLELQKKCFEDLCQNQVRRERESKKSRKNDLDVYLSPKSLSPELKNMLYGFKRGLKEQLKIVEEAIKQQSAPASDRDFNILANFYLSYTDCEELVCNDYIKKLVEKRKAFTKFYRPDPKIFKMDLEELKNYVISLDQKMDQAHPRLKELTKEETPIS